MAKKENTIVKCIKCNGEIEMPEPKLAKHVVFYVSDTPVVVGCETTSSLMA